MTALPLPQDTDVPVGVLVAQLAGHLGVRRTVAICLDLMDGADRTRYLPELEFLTGVRFEPGSPKLDPERWKDYWGRVWGARGLLYVWADDAASAVVAGLADEHWRPAEMCLKVSTLRELGEAGPGAVRLLEHQLPRVRAQALRTLGAAGDVEHVDAVRQRIDDEHPDVRRAAGRALDRMVVRLDLEPEPER